MCDRWLRKVSLKSDIWAETSCVKTWNSVPGWTEWQMQWHKGGSKLTVVEGQKEARCGQSVVKSEKRMESQVGVRSISSWLSPSNHSNLSLNITSSGVLSLATLSEATNQSLPTCHSTLLHYRAPLSIWNFLVGIYLLLCLFVVYLYVPGCRCYANKAFSVLQHLEHGPKNNGG